MKSRETEGQAVIDVALYWAALSKLLRGVGGELARKATLEKWAPGEIQLAVTGDNAWLIAFAQEMRAEIGLSPSELRIRWRIIGTG